MTNTQPQTLTVGSGAMARRIAYLADPARIPDAPTLIWLTGLKSDMVSTKAEALASWAVARGLGMVRFDYSGHGRSDGRFEDAVISDWIAEAEAILHHVAQGQVILAGSSTGGHVALALLRRLQAGDRTTAARIAGLMLVAPAWNLSEDLMWKQFPPEARRAVLEDGRWVRPSDYDPAGYVITRAFIEDGRNDLIGETPFDPGCPVAILQGLQDTDVPPEHTRKLVSLLPPERVQVVEVTDGGHRLSRPQDLDAMFALIEELIARARTTTRSAHP